MTPEERARVVEELPGEVTWDEMALPEGGRHSRAKVLACDLLMTHFERQGRTVYVEQELPVYYPDAQRFAPDVLVVLDVPTHVRDKWVVAHEGKGLDWVLEVHVGGDRKKDAVKNVKRYAQLGIREYFILDGEREELVGYRLASPKAREYTRIEPRNGRYRSEVLGAELGLEDGELRVWVDGTSVMPSKFVVAVKDAAERSERRAQQQARRAEAESRRAEAEARQREEAERRAEAEARQREEAERQLARLKAELDRLRRE